MKTLYDALADVVDIHNLAEAISEILAMDHVTEVDQLIATRLAYIKKRMDKIWRDLRKEHYGDEW
jgi:hypothetical protein